MFSLRFLFSTLTLCLLVPLVHSRAANKPPNILLITVDDMNCDSVGAYGCKLADTTPHMDRLASESLRFNHAHVQVGNCMPSRNVLYSGRYPHNNRIEGFYQVKNAGWPHVVDVLKGAGYYTAIRGKVSHSTPYMPYAWDSVLDTAVDDNVHPKNVDSYYKSTKRGLAGAKKAQKPCLLIINVSDPHKPFFGTAKGNKVTKDSNVPSRVFTASEVPVPGFLPEHPAIRNELAQYYSSVRRADDCVGAILRALEESGQSKNTIVMFLSDHGMPLPFAKTQLYHHSTRTPWMVRWPGVTKPNSVDDTHMISAVDFLPTVCDILKIEHPKGMDGRSFASLIRDEKQGDRDFVYKVYNENSGGARHPMRSVDSTRFGYLFNPWSDGKRVMKTATTGTASYRTLKQLAAKDEKIAARLDLFDHRVLEEFYDYEHDPDALVNLIDDPKYKDEIERHRRAMDDFMARSNDHVLEAFRNRGDPQALASYMQEVEAESAARRANRRKGKRKRNLKLISMKTPKSVVVGKPFVVQISHTLGRQMAEQQVHVTIKDGKAEKRIERKAVTVSGKGIVDVAFTLPATCDSKSVRFAAFAGKDFASSLQHITAGPTPVKSTSN